MLVPGSELVTSSKSDSHESSGHHHASASTFSRTDTVTDSERFYTSLLYMLEDERESCEVELLIAWWNRYAKQFLRLQKKSTFLCRKIFPHSSPESVLAPVEGSALDRIRQRRAEMEERLRTRV